MINFKALKKIAKNRVDNVASTEEELEEFLAIWWSRKYGLPSNHPLFLSRVLEEHLIDYYVNDFLDKPEESEEVTLEEQEEYEEWVKEQMGEDYDEDEGYAYLIDPDSDETFESYQHKQVLDNIRENTLGANIQLDDEDGEEKDTSHHIKSLDEIDDDFSQFDLNKDDE